MKKLAIIGNPLAHSLSPVMQNAALKHLGIDCEYVAIELKREVLEPFIANARKTFFGFNVTAPFKSAVIPFLDAVDDDCLLAQSVNTVVNKGGKETGKSTDGYGLEKALDENFDVNPLEQNIFFIGCGGAAKAAAVHLLNKGIKQIVLANRTIEKVASFVDIIKLQYPKQQIEYCTLDDHYLINKHLDKNPILVQATSLGIKDDDPSPFPPELFRKDLRVFDMVYKNTKFLRIAESKGCICSNGLLMLLYQGACSFEIWTDLEAPIEVMKEALLTHLKK